ncbi:hypothetical protein ACGFIW_01985 [Micromonospora sp. NPDC048935]|uniref:hypothetical protein n=1 Tax=Micromonospora sp. NPDC048935 TaxID=3364262 RepID=UPI0037213985
MTAAVIATPRPQPKPGDPFPPPWPGAPRHTQQATCPTCDAPVGSLLAACFATKACLTNDLDYDAAIDARCDA